MVLQLYTINHSYLPFFDVIGLIDHFHEKYEGYAVVQGLSDQHEIDLLLAQLKGLPVDWYVWTTQHSPPQCWNEVVGLLV